MKTGNDYVYKFENAKASLDWVPNMTTQSCPILISNN